MTWKQKALAVQYYDKMIPKPTYEELAQWCKAKFKLPQSPHKSTVLSWLKSDVKAFVEVANRGISSCTEHEVNVRMRASSA